MPKVSKIRSKREIVAEDNAEAKNIEVFRCTRCGKEYKVQRNNFPRVQSVLYKYNNCFSVICNSCVDYIYERYVYEFKEPSVAAERICQKLDVYWSKNVFDGVVQKNKNGASEIRSYIGMTNLTQYSGKTYDDTLTEYEKNRIHPILGLTEVKEVSDDVEAFWGKGLSNSHYIELERRLKNWKGDRDISDFDMGELTVIKQICMLEVQINLDAAAGKSIDKNVKALDSLLGSGNLRPVQKKTDDSDSKEDKTPFGVWINRIENDEPIPEPSEEFKDVDGIVKYVSTWFLGHMCKMLKVNNRFSNLYEEELAKLTVERPEYEGDDDEDIVEDIFERANKAAEIASKMSEEDEYDEL